MITFSERLGIRNFAAGDLSYQEEALASFNANRLDRSCLELEYMREWVKQNYNAHLLAKYRQRLIDCGDEP